MKTMLRHTGRIGQALWLALILTVGGWSTAARAQQTLLDLLTADSPMNLLSDGGFESGVPSYWEAVGDGAAWTRERSRTPEWSLKLSGTGASSWVQSEAIRNWTPRIPGNLELVVGGWVWTEGVNTNPQTDEEKFQLVFTFYNSAGQDLLGGPLVIDVPQDQPSTNGWVQIDNTSLGSLILPEDATSVRIAFRKGSQATGTVYLDDVFVRKADPNAEGWEGDFFNANVDVSGGWYYWWPDFPRGLAGWPASQEFAVTVTESDAHSGRRSLRIEDLQGTAQYEAVAISERVPVVAGEPVLVSFWVRYEGVASPETIGEGNNNIGLTALWYNQMESGAAGWGEIGGVDIRLNGEYNEQVIPLAAREDSTGWRQYAFVVYPKEGAVGMELRLRYWHEFTGTTYWDDVSIVRIGGSALLPTGVSEESSVERPQRFLLHANYPNPFRRSTTLSFSLPEPTRVTLAVYNLLGQEVATLIRDELLPAGMHRVVFDARDLPAGLYLYQLRAGRYVETRKMLLVK
ncbi:T9SS type A sorting domain-containing protein [Rhodothermus marinus]|uniref:T9SS type A sorting domain-containing protein n=1 Tax=Rhodothermus marinus TaxID=29549 RepID=UPI0006910026|nr:T9SS type A sorting domain-containing protein [Rhodothermus marinus]